MSATTFDDRRREILRTLIHLHVETGEPVGSESLSRAINRTLSPATLRNIMADLEALGYLGGTRESPTGDRNLAAIHFEAGRYAEAEVIYRQLVEKLDLHEERGWNRRGRAPDGGCRQQVPAHGD